MEINHVKLLDIVKLCVFRRWRMYEGHVLLYVCLANGDNHQVLFLETS